MRVDKCSETCINIDSCTNLVTGEELAEMHAQIPPSNHGQGKLGGGVTGSMHEMSSSAVCL